MADAQGGKVFGWFRTIFTGAFGLVSGAALMYFTPLVDRFIKPGKPVANFKYEADGLKVVFHNRSVGAADGWWDFGDGSALEPFSDEGAVSHTYARPGVYTVKLGLRNLLGEENERAVNLTLEGGGGPPAVETLEVVPTRTDTYAPATFRVVSQVKGAELCVFCLGDEQPAEVVADTAGRQERLVTFKQPGTHTVKLFVVSGKQHVERKVAVRVEPQPPGVAMAVLNVTQHSVHVETKRLEHSQVVAFPNPSKDRVHRFALEFPAAAGFDLVKAEFAQPVKEPFVKNAKLEVWPDRKKVKVTGELVKDGAVPPRWTAKVALTQEKKTAPVTLAPKQIAATLALPGTTLLPLPADQCGWQCRQRQYQLELREGERAVWQVTQLPISGELVLRGQRYRVSAKEAGNQVQLDVTSLGAALPPVGN